ncbi:MAG: MBL fold metallo-hydrolase [Candidatus Parcubacteria bacterium]|nr:MBL fold metallo-hydrolase [Candidatus Parcubacteria bacterium]
MTIFWHGQGAFKIVEKDVVVAIDPHDKTGLKMPKFQAQILLITDTKDQYINAEGLRGDSFMIDGAGEYEVKNVFVYGIPAEKKDNEKITIYLIEMEGIKIAHLGMTTQDTLTDKQLEILEGVDILLVPVGGGDSLKAASAVKIISQIQPRVVIPMYYKLPGLNQKLDSLDVFLKEYGAAQPETVDKYKISKKDLPQEETRVVVLAAT